jgi:hypothetical protein
MSEPQFKTGDRVRDCSGLKDVDGRVIEGRVVSSIDGRLIVLARDGRRYLYGGPYILRPLTNLERVTRFLHLR